MSSVFKTELIVPISSNNIYANLETFMFDAKKLLEQLLGAELPGNNGSVRQKAGQAIDLAKANPWKTGALAAAVFGTETGRKLAGKAASVGGLAAIAGLGYLAYKNYQSGQAPQQAPKPEPELLAPPASSPFNVQSASMTNDFALKLIQAMIGAANADGHIDDAERAHILDKVRVSEIDPEAEAFLEKEIANPIGLDELVAAARTQEQKVELYAASRIAVNQLNRAERGYLDQLAARLGLEDALVDHIDATVMAATA